MTTPVYEQMEAIQYDGTNGQAIADLILNGQIQSDNGSLLVIHDGSSDFYINDTDWVVLGRGSGLWLGNAIYRVLMVRSAADYALQFNNV